MRPDLFRIILTMAMAITAFVKEITKTTAAGNHLTPWIISFAYSMVFLRHQSGVSLMAIPSTLKYSQYVQAVHPPQKVEMDSAEALLAAAKKAASATREITDDARRLLNRTRTLLGLPQRDWR